MQRVVLQGRIGFCRTLFKTIWFFVKALLKLRRHECIYFPSFMSFVVKLPVKKLETAWEKKLFALGISLYYLEKVLRILFTRRNCQPALLINCRHRESKIVLFNIRELRCVQIKSWRRKLVRCEIPLGRRSIREKKAGSQHNFSSAIKSESFSNDVSMLVLTSTIAIWLIKSQEAISIWNFVLWKFFSVVNWLFRNCLGQNSNSFWREIKSLFLARILFNVRVDGLARERKQIQNLEKSKNRPIILTLSPCQNFKFGSFKGSKIEQKPALISLKAYPIWSFLR